MFKKMPIRLRLTLLSIILITACCIGLTAILNFSAYRMANKIEAAIMEPAQAVDNEGMPIEGIPAVKIEPPIQTESSKGARNAFFQNSIIYMLMIVAIGGGLTYYISGKALQPLNELNSQMKNRTVHNLFEDLPMPKSNDEIADLTRSFNEMSRELGDAFAMQKRFSQSAAHELRTPLTVIKTKIEVFNKKKERTPEEYAKLLVVIASHTNRLNALVNDLLNLTNMDKLDCDEAIELKSMLSDVSNELCELAKGKNISVALDGEEMIIQGNRLLLHRAFYNLIENAIKYNNEFGRVNISICALEGKSIITVSDTGIGIPQKMQELIFEPFFRVDKSRSREVGGTGLGLSTVKSIIKKHNGQISAARNENGGTVFKIILG